MEMCHSTSLQNRSSHMVHRAINCMAMAPEPETHERFSKLMAISQNIYKCVCQFSVVSHSLDCSPPSSSVHGILQARILEWVAFPFSRDFPKPGIKPRSPASQAVSLLSKPSGKPIYIYIYIIKPSPHQSHSLHLKNPYETLARFWIIEADYVYREIIYEMNKKLDWARFNCRGSKEERISYG